MSEYEAEPGLSGPSQYEGETAESGGRGTVREFQREFETEGHTVQGASTKIRPDAVSIDHLTAFTLGPIEEGDPSQGANIRVWRVRADQGTLYLAGATSDGWSEEKAILSYSGPPILELDIAFEQNGRAVITAERATGPGGTSEVWVDWYDPRVPGYVFIPLGPGRTPRALLDNPNDVTDSDVLLFYVTDSGTKMRAQRERYETEHDTPLPGGPNIYLGDVARAREPRLIMLYFVRDTASGTYSVHRATSKLYPYVLESEDYELGAEARGVTLYDLILERELEVESGWFDLSVRRVDVWDVIIDLTLEIEHARFDFGVLSVDLRDLVISPLLEVDHYRLGGVTLGAKNKIVIIDRTFLDDYWLGGVPRGVTNNVVVQDPLLEIEHYWLGAQVRGGTLAAA